MHDMALQITPIYFSASLAAAIVLLFALWTVLVSRRLIPRFFSRVSFLVRPLAILSAVAFAVAVTTYIFLVREPFARGVALLNNETATVSVNGVKLTHVKDFRRAFIGYRYLKRKSGTSPQEKLEVQIASEESTIFFILRRDSHDPEFYWVFHPEYKYFSSIGFVTTSTLDQF